MLKFAHSVMFLRNHLTMLSLTDSLSEQSGTITHLGGFSLRPAIDSAPWKMGDSRCRCFSRVRATPISSAHARAIPLFAFLSLSCIKLRNGSRALCNRNAEPGQPCRTPDKNTAAIFNYIACTFSGYHAVRRAFRSQAQFFSYNQNILTGPQLRVAWSVFVDTLFVEPGELGSPCRKFSLTIFQAS